MDEVEALKATTTAIPIKQRREMTPTRMEEDTTKMKTDSKPTEEVKKTLTLHHPGAAEEVVEKSECGEEASAKKKGEECG